MDSTYICYSCNIYKNFNDFYKCNNSRGVQFKCKKCDREYKNLNKERYNENNRNKYKINIIKEKERKALFYKNNKERLKEESRIKYHQNNGKEKRHNRYLKNKDKSREYSRNYRKNNLEKVREYHRNYVKNKRNTNLHYKLEHRLRNRLLIALKRGRGSKSVSFIELIGCKIEYLKTHIEYLFKDGMNWESFNNSEIVIDHIKPCCSFDLTKLEEQRKCFHYTNLQPMWEKDNRSKLSEDIKLRIIK